MQRNVTIALCLLAVAIPLACSRTGPPNSLFESAGYHVRDGTVYYLNAFPGRAFGIEDADAATFTALDATYARDKSHVYVNGAVLPDADAASFELLDRPGLAKDRNHIYQRDRAISDDPAHFELLDGQLAKDSHVVYWSDLSVLSDDPAHFAIVSTADHYLYTKRRPDSSRQRQRQHRRRPLDLPGPAGRLCTRQPTRLLFRSTDYRGGDIVVPASDSAHVYWMGKTINGADPLTFQVERELRMLSRRSARLLPTNSHRRRRPTDVPARPARHQLLRYVDLVRRVALYAE